MADTYLQTLTELERITRLMLQQAQCAAWEQVEALEQERKLLVSHDHAWVNATEDQVQAQALLEAIIELDMQISMLARARRAELSEQLKHLNRGRKARQAYQAIVLPK